MALSFRMSISSSLVLELELLHEVDERLHALDGHGVVDGSAHTARETVSFEGDEPRAFRLFDELGVQLRGGSDEGDVHHGAILGIHLVFVERRVVDEVVEHRGFLAVDLLHRGDAAHLLEIAHVEHHDVDWPAGGRVVEAVVRRMDGIFEHGGADRHLAAQHILSHDDEGDARGSEVLLRAGVDQGVLVHVRDLAHDAGGHVGHQGSAAVGQIVPLGAEDGVVLGDVDVVDVIPEILAGDLGDVGVARLFGGRDQADVAVFYRFFISLLGEVARHDVVCATLLQKIEGDRLELRGRAALEKEHFILVGDVHQLAHEGDAFVVDGLVDLAAVAELHDAHA